MKIAKNEQNLANFNKTAIVYYDETATTIGHGPQWLWMIRDNWNWYASMICEQF